MCAIDDCEPATFWQHTDRRARIAHRCDECTRFVLPGEVYRYSTWLFDGRWTSMKVCQHCMAAGEWLNVMCGGWPIGGLGEELTEHWDEGYTSVGFGRLIVGFRRRWHDGRDPVPERAEVRALASKMMRAAVAA